LFDVTGKRTSTSATITVNGVVHPTNGYQPNGNGLHFRLEVGNTPTPLQTADIFEPVTVTQTIGSGSPVSLRDDPLQFVPPSVTASPPRYDLDGNLLSDGRWTYTWDGENRLVKMVSVAWTQPAGGYLANATFPAVTLEFAYDGLSRRVQKKTIKNGTAEMEGYLYDGWNVVMISKLDPANLVLPVRKWSCVWRPDIGSRLYARGSWQAAGGVGGLAWLQTGIAQTVYPYYTYSQVTGNGEVHIPMMDHMGNVRHYYQIKTTANYSNPATVTGQITANLDYDAFGREVRATGPKTPASGQPPGLAPGDPWVDVLPFHFSTKFTDKESGLNYYGYRFYDPVDGRWINRDPLGERGGLNLYSALGNAPSQYTDYLGMVLIIADAEIRKLIACWKSNPTEAPKVLELIERLEDSKDIYKIVEFAGDDRVGWPGFDPNTNKLAVPHIKEFETRSPVDTRIWSFPEAVAHELLHASDDARGEALRDEGHTNADFLRDELAVTKEVANCKKCPGGKFKGRIVKYFNAQGVQLGREYIMPRSHSKP
jgi:RHS repeat-associated protein